MSRSKETRLANLRALALQIEAGLANFRSDIDHDWDAALVNCDTSPRMDIAEEKFEAARLMFCQAMSELTAATLSHPV